MLANALNQVATLCHTLPCTVDKGISSLEVLCHFVELYSFLRGINRTFSTPSSCRHPSLSRPVAFARLGLPSFLRQDRLVCGLERPE